LQRLAAGHYSIASFYAARIRRIFPALFMMLVLIVPAAVLLLDPKALGEFARLLGATGLFLSNLELHRTTGYFEGAAELKPLVHTWSLAVEEQYYIVFPPLLALVYRYWRPGIGWALLAAGAASLGYSVWQLRYDASLAFYSAASRTFELMIGSGLAWWVSQDRPAVWLKAGTRDAVATIGLVGVVSSALFLRAETVFPGLMALLPCIGAALMIWTGGEGSTRVGRLLAWAPLRWIGAMSFSLYLWHWPALVFTRHLLLNQPNALQAGVAVSFSLLMAWASLRWVETPVRLTTSSRRTLLLAGAIAISMSLICAWGLRIWAEFAVQRPGPATQMHTAATDISPKRKQCHDTGNRTTKYADRCVFGAKDAANQVAVWGDSHGVELAMALGDYASSRPADERLFNVAQITSSSCPPSLGLLVADRSGCLRHNESTLTSLVSDPHVSVVLLVARFEFYHRSPNRAALEPGLVRAAQALHTAGKRVVLLDPIPTYAYPVPSALAQLVWRGQDPVEFGQTLGQYEEMQRETLEMLARVAKRTSAKRVVSAEALCPAGRCLVVDANGLAFYFDDNHLSMQGARQLAPFILRAVDLPQ
jgi:peptidoglycan/LPS O-acetylase OafA/YrhL